MAQRQQTHRTKPQATKPVCNRIGIVFDFDADVWSQPIEISEGQRVANLAPAAYQEDSELMRSLTPAVESLCKQISLRQLSVGE